MTLGTLIVPTATLISCGQEETFAKKYYENSNKEGKISDTEYIKFDKENKTFTLDLSKDETLKVIPSQAFYNINTREIVEKVEEIQDGDKKVFKNVKYYLTKIIFPKNLEKIEKNAFRANSTNLNAEHRIKELDFSQATKLSRIENFAFIDNSITSLILPNSIDYIGEGAFNNNELTELNIGLESKLRFIDISAFAKNKLKNVEIQSLKLTTIKLGAFSYNNINDLVLNPQNPNTLRIEDKAFYENPIKKETALLPANADVHPKAFE